MAYVRLTDPELARIEARARQLRAETLRAGLSAVAARIRALFTQDAPNKAGRAA